MKIKQIIALVVVVALLMAGSVLATFAYLTASQEIENTFTIGKVSITLDEAKVDEYGRPLNEEGNVAEEGDTIARHAAGNQYKLIPGHTYAKDPTITVGAGSEESYIRMIVTIEDYVDLCAAYNATVTLETLTGGLNEGWTVHSEENGIIECWYDTTVNVGDEIPALFSEITLSTDIDDTELETLDALKIVVVAHAIQADGLNSSEAAWAAFDGE